MRHSSLFQKFKTFEFKKWYVVVLVLLAVLIRFWGESSVTMLQREVPVVTDTEVSADEIARYIQTKQAYLDENITINPDILVSRDMEDYLDRETHEWFLLQKWRPKRFFYVQDRLKFILNYIHAREKKQEEADLLERQADSLLALNFSGDEEAPEVSEAAQLQKQAHDIRYYINRDIRQAGISADEDNLVMNNLSVIEYLTAQ